MLLDTHVLLRAAAGNARQTTVARALLLDPEQELWFNAASIREVAIKRAPVRPDFRTDPAVLRRGLLTDGDHELPIEWSAPVRVDRIRRRF